MIPAGITSHQPCITFDFTASIARIAGVHPAAAKPLEGMDIIDHVAQHKADVTRVLYWRKPRGNTVWMGVRDGNLKFVARQRGDQYEDHLFDLVNDPPEKNDLKAERQADFVRMRNLYREWEQRTRRNCRGRLPHQPATPLNGNTGTPKR